MGLFCKKSVAASGFGISVVDVSRATHSNPQLVFIAEGDVVSGLFIIQELS